MLTGSTQIEFDQYIPPDVTVNADGTIAVADMTKVYRFNNQVDQFSQSFTGMGMPPVKYITQSGPYQHGETVLDYKLQTRLIQYIHRRNGCSRTEYWSNRSDLINWLRPNRQLVGQLKPGRLRKIQPDGTKRDIEAFLMFGPMFGARNTGQWDEWALTEALRFRCDDPTFFDPALQTVRWTIDADDGLIFYESPDWEDHLTFPIVFSGDAISAYQTISGYAGTWSSFPTIVFTGPINAPRIENVTLGETIELTYNIAAGETVTIDLSFGNKTVKSSSGANLIGTVTTDSTLGTFRIAPDPEAPNGDNVLYASGAEGALATTAIALSYYTRYIGI